MKKTHKGEGMTDSGIEGQIKLAFKVNGLKTNNLLYKDILTIVRQAEATHTKQLQAILDEYGPKFTMKCKAGPPSDYQDLWYLTKEFRTKLEGLLKP